MLEEDCNILSTHQIHLKPDGGVKYLIANTTQAKKPPECNFDYKRKDPSKQ